MSDVIVQRFEADANDFVREVNRARESVKKMSVTDLPLVQSEMNQAFAQSQQAARGMQQMGAAARSSGNNILVAAQFADDLQYGFRGIANQIPQAAMALGMGAGLAGAISLVALAAAKGIPLLMEFYSSADSKPVVDAARAYGKALDENLAKLRDLRVEQERARALADGEATTAAGVQQAIGGGSPELEMVERKIEALKRQRAAEDAVREAQERAARARVEAGGGDVSGVQAQQLAAAQEIAQRRAAEDEALRRELGRVATEESNRLDEVGKNYAAGFTASMAEAREELARLERNAVFSAAAAAQAAAELEAVKDKGYSKRVAETGNAKATAERKQADADAVSAQKALLESLERQRVETEGLLEAQERAASAKANAAAEEQMRGREAAAQAEAVAVAQAEELAAQRQAAAAARERVEAEKRVADEKRRAMEAEREAARAKAQDGARADFAGELQALRLQAAGREDEAKALRDQMRMRAESVALAREAGITEAQALKLVREKYELERRVNGEKERAAAGPGGRRPRAGRIGLYDRGGSADGAFGGGVREGLGSSVIERNVAIAEARAASRKGEGQSQVRTVEKLDDVAGTMRKLLAVWENGLSVK